MYGFPNFIKLNKDNLFYGKCLHSAFQSCGNEMFIHPDTQATFWRFESYNVQEEYNFIKPDIFSLGYQEVQLVSQWKLFIYGTNLFGHFWALLQDYSYFTVAKTYCSLN